MQERLTYILALPEENIKRWIDGRMGVDDAPPTFDPFVPFNRSRQDELPESLPAEMFRESSLDHPFRENLRAAVEDLLESSLSGEDSSPKPYWLRNIISLAHQVNILGKGALLRQAFESGRFSQGDYDVRGIIDVNNALLQLLDKQRSEPLDFWSALVSNPRYCAVAFDAIPYFGIEATVEVIPDFIKARESLRKDWFPEQSLPATLAFSLKRLHDKHFINEEWEQLKILINQRLSDEEKDVLRQALGLFDLEL